MNYYGNNDFRDYKYLMHYGVKGMKWGKRKKRSLIDVLTGNDYKKKALQEQQLADKVKTGYSKDNKNNFNNSKAKYKTHLNKSSAYRKKAEKSVLGTLRRIGKSTVSKVKKFIDNNVGTYKPGKDTVILSYKKKPSLPKWTSQQRNDFDKLVEGAYTQYKVNQTKKKAKKKVSKWLSDIFG